VPQASATAAIHGPQRPMTTLAEPYHPPMVGGRRELPQLVVILCPWSVLGPHGVRNRWSAEGTSGHDGYGESASHGPSTHETSGTAAGGSRFEIPPPPWVLPAQQQRILGLPIPGSRVLASARIAPRRPPAALDPGRGPRPEACQQPGRQDHAISMPYSASTRSSDGQSRSSDLRRSSMGEGRHEW
jgi:hypothetical protein